MSMQWQFSAPVLVRLAGQGSHGHEALRFQRTLRALDRFAAVQRWLEAHRDEVCDRVLFQAAAGVDGPLRSQLVALKRKYFNAAAPRAGELACLSEIADETQRRLALRYARRLQRIKQLRERATQVFDRELEHQRDALRGYLRRDDFVKAVQLNSPTLARNVRSLVSKPAREWAKSERQTEATAMRYYSRMVAKTSPFGRWGLVAAGRVNPQRRERMNVRLKAPRLTAKSHLNLALCARIMHSVSEVPEVAASLPLRLNPTAFIEGPQLCFYDPSGRDGSTPYTRLRRGPLLPWMAQIVEYLKDHPAPLPHAALVAAVADAHGLDEAARRKLSQGVTSLTGSGLLVRELGQPTDRLSQLSAAADALGRHLGHGHERWSQPLRQLEQWGQAFADQGVEGRRQILEQVQAQSSALGADAHAPLPALVVEDSGLAGLEVELGQEWVQEVGTQLNLLLQLFAVRDREGVNLQLFKDIFVHLHGVGGRCANLHQLASSYARTLFGVPLTDTAIFSRAAKANALGQRYMDRLLARMEGAGRELVIPQEELQQWVDEFSAEAGGPATPAARSAAVHLQLAATDAEAMDRGDYLAVLNYTLPGFGRFFTRYCDLLPDAGWDRDIHEQLQRLQEQAGAPVVELQSVLAHNAQVHPPLTDRVLVLAGERSDRPLALDASDVSLEHDPDTDELIYRHHGERVIPMYMGFFHSLALPMTHRVLVDGVPFTYHAERNRPVDYREGLLAAGKDEALKAQVRHYPRLRFGRIVVQRESWAMGTMHLPAVRRSEGDFALFSAFRDWRAQHGLPARMFVRVKRPAGQGGRSSDHKPIYVDFDNHLSLRSWHSALDTDHLETLIFEEALPDLGCSPIDLGDGPLAFELQVELTQWRGGAA
ncbi:lantibiotic dehydratase [Roseateles terrae]|uniref:Lantibiotic dehydratase N-terminal domain-containing protein n=1 Tax=Roseateles terrae TaxID=431060 RepID=A0ABR6GMH1_9BURK|nr:lantibiotic dehydratase [Roseateles terrae]MBB3192867.1 hypothetical protein [Roseateles terrae]OWQ89872.1 hypothetical protein CDN98_05060 [Roseateles terrae]